jgi:N-carbamoyl-L-amino-acid hydrolase
VGEPGAERTLADPQRVLSGLDRLRELSGTGAGAQRVAWTPAWAHARAWLREQLEPLPVVVEVDEAGNLWATLAGSSSRSLVIGSHLDSVPNGGWLDGCLGVLAGLEVLRALAAGPTPPIGVRLVDWADEEGARFGRSLFGSSAVAGSLDPDEVRDLTDAAGVSLPDALAEYGVILDQVPRAGERLREVTGYVELHIEQGPVLEDAGIALGVVEAAYGVLRHRVRFDGRAAHAGATPMRLRRDALVAAARFVLGARAGAVEHGGVATVGEIHAEPGIPTAVPGVAGLFLDQRHHDAETLELMLDDARSRAREIAAEEQTPVHWTAVQKVAPVAFDQLLIEVAEECVRAVIGDCARLPSGALHDAVMVARTGVPAVMLFVQSIGGISHSPIEDSRREHIAQGVVTLDLLVRRLLEASGG